MQILNNHYYNEEISKDSWLDTRLASSISIENFFGEKFFKNDLSRIIYSPTNLAFRERGRKNEGNLQLPFMNYYLSDIQNDTDNRSLWNNLSQVQGVHDIEGYQALLGTTLRLVPIKLVFESILWFNQPLDLLYATHKAQDISANETILYADYQARNNIVFRTPLFLNFNFEYNTQFEQQDWLEQNKILSLGLDFEIITYFLYMADGDTISITEECILNFIATKNINYTNPLLSEPRELLIEYFS